MLGKITCAAALSTLMVVNAQQELAVQNLVGDLVRDLRAPREGPVEAAMICDPRYQMCDSIDTRINQDDTDTSGDRVPSDDREQAIILDPQQEEA